MVYLCLCIAIPGLADPTMVHILFTQGTVVGCLSIGMAFVILLGQIDLSMVAVMGFSPLIGVYAIEILGAPFYVGIIFTLLTGAGIGLFNGLMVEKLKIPAIIQTLVSWWIFWGLLLVLTGGISKSVASPEWSWVGNASIGPIRVIVIVFLSLVAIVYFFTKYTVYGLRFYQTGGNRNAAQSAGINTGRIMICGFIISGTIAALAGYLLSSRLALVSPRFGEEWFMPSIAAPVIAGFTLTGGRGNFINIVAGAFLVQLIVIAVRVSGLGGWWEQLTQGFLIFFAVIVDVFRKRLMGLEL
ncbi:MAG: ABC transporter permease [Candidatus Bathyarchaeia archaeon]